MKRKELVDCLQCSTPGEMVSHFRDECPRQWLRGCMDEASIREMVHTILSLTGDDVVLRALAIARAWPMGKQ